MTIQNFIRKGVFTAVAFIIIAWLGQYFYIVDGQLDLFRFMLVFGLTIGAPCIFFIIPMHGSVSAIMGALVFAIIIGGLLGSVAAAGVFIRMIYYLVGYPVAILFNRKKKVR
ncbi:MAG: hypothetical protein PHT76_12795 [Anaerostipes sp.]|nr:hypothetical protein [Anaerostipes sp.]